MGFYVKTRHEKSINSSVAALLLCSTIWISVLFRFSLCKQLIRYFLFRNFKKFSLNTFVFFFVFNAFMLKQIWIFCLTQQNESVYLIDIFWVCVHSTVLTKLYELYACFAIKVLTFYPTVSRKKKIIQYINNVLRIAIFFFINELN